MSVTMLPSGGVVFPSWYPGDINTTFNNNSSVKSNVESPKPSQPDDAMAKLWELAQSDPEYMEVYLQNLTERENTTRAQAWYEKMSNSQYQRAAEDLRKAGLNPYLLLQNMSGAGAGSVSPAGTSSISARANRNQRQQNSMKAMQIAGAVATSIIAMLVMMA